MSLSVSSMPKVYRQASHSNVVTSVAFSPDGKTLASGSWDGTVKLWDVRDGKPRLKRTYRGEWDEVEAVAFMPDGEAVVGVGTGFDSAPFGVVMLWNTSSTRGRTLVCEPGKIDTMALSPDGKTLATASGDCCAVTLWDVASGEVLTTLPDHHGPIRSVAYSPDGHDLAVASGVVPGVTVPTQDEKVGEICLWDLSGKKPRPRERLTGHEYGILSVAFSLDGKKLASAGFDRIAKLWRVIDGKETLALAGHTGWVATIAFSPDGELVATGSHDQNIKLWETSKGREIATLAGHTGNVYSVAFSPDGSLLASGSLDGTVRLWEVERVLNWAAREGKDSIRYDNDGDES